MTLRVAIVCGHFIPDLGYFEVHLARACSRLGHSVRVITSVKVPSYVKGFTFSVYNAGTVLTPEPTYSIHRLPAIMSAGQIVLSNGVNKAVQSFDPDLIFVIGLGKVFPKPVFDLDQYRQKIITILGDNEHSFSNGSLKTRVVRSLMKKPVYKMAIRHSKCLYAYTNSTQKIVSAMVGEELANELDKKLEQISLGFDGETFNYNEVIRKTKRAELGINDAYTWICVSRISPNKDFEPFLLGLAKLKNSGVEYNALFVGADKEGEERLLLRINALDIEAKVKILPFQEHTELNALYNAADAAWYPMAAISNFEGLGTGLPVMLPKEKNVSHIIHDGIEGAYYEKSEVPQLMLNWTRKGAADGVRNADNSCEEFEYKSIVRKILEDCQEA